MSKYRVNIIWDEEDQIFIARVPELDGVVTHGDTLIQVAQHAEEAIDLHLQTLKSLNEPIPKPIAELNLSGTMSLRMGKERHETAYLAAEKSGKSMNEFVCELIDSSAKAVETPATSIQIDEIDAEFLKKALGEVAKAQHKVKFGFVVAGPTAVYGTPAGRPSHRTVVVPAAAARVMKAARRVSLGATKMKKK